MTVKKIVSVVLGLMIACACAQSACVPAQSACAQIEYWDFIDGSRLIVFCSTKLDDVRALYEKKYVPKKLSADAKDAIVFGSGISVIPPLTGAGIYLRKKSEDKEISKGKKTALKAVGITLIVVSALAFVPGIPLAYEGLEKLEEDKSGKASGGQYTSPKWMFDQLNREKEMLEQFNNSNGGRGFAQYLKMESKWNCNCNYNCHMGFEQCLGEGSNCNDGGCDVGCITDPKALGNYEGCYVILERPIQKKVYADREMPCFIRCYWKKQDKRGYEDFCKYNIKDKISNLIRSGIKVKSHGIIIRQGDKFEFQEQKQEVHCAPHLNFD